MQKLDDVVVSDDPPSTGLGQLLGGDDLPVVVRVIVRIACDLLPCGSEAFKLVNLP